MYAIHTTPGFVIESRPFGEAGKALAIFTRDLGLVLATATGIRLEKSKLRYHTQDYTFGIFSFVRGKEMWRLTSAQGSMAADKAPRSNLVAKIALLLKRLLQGEQAHPELFDLIQSGFDFLHGQASGQSGEDLETFESVIVYLILKSLGYIGDDPLAGILPDQSSFTVENILSMSSKRTIMNRHINKALRESHL